MLIHYQAGYTDLLLCRSPVVSSYVLKILAIGFALLELFCKRVYIIIRFWKLPTFPSPKPTLTLTYHLGKNVGLGKG